MDRLEEQLAELELAIRKEPLLNSAGASPTSTMSRKVPPPVPDKPKKYTVNRTIMITDAPINDNYSNTPTLPLRPKLNSQPGSPSYKISQEQGPQTKYYPAVNNSVPKGYGYQPTTENRRGHIALPPRSDNTYNYQTLPAPEDLPLPPPPPELYLPPPPAELLLPPTPPPSAPPSDIYYGEPGGPPPTRPIYSNLNFVNEAPPKYQPPSPVNNASPRAAASKSNYVAPVPFNAVKNDVPPNHIKPALNNKKDNVDNVIVQDNQSDDDPEYDDENGYGPCSKCGQMVLENGCMAMNRVFHNKCFTCAKCNTKLNGKVFYELDGLPYCDDDFLVTLEKCTTCNNVIKGKVLRATGKPYHAECFCCVVCGQSLAGVPFTVDFKNEVHCIDDFYKKYAPMCWACNQLIIPEDGEEETHRMVALDHSYHIRCFKCEDCGISLISDKKGACYPLDDHIFCKNCNAKRIQQLTS